MHFFWKDKKDKNQENKDKNQEKETAAAKKQDKVQEHDEVRKTQQEEKKDRTDVKINAVLSFSEKLTDEEAARCLRFAVRDLASGKRKVTEYTVLFRAKKLRMYSVDGPMPEYSESDSVNRTTIWRFLKHFNAKNIVFGRVTCQTKDGQPLSQYEYDIQERKWKRTK